MVESFRGLLQDRQTFIQFLHLVLPSDVLEEKITDILNLGKDGYGLFDYNNLFDIWTQLQLTKRYE